MMKEKLKKNIINLFVFILILCTTTISFNIEKATALDNQAKKLTEKISKDYSKKFCNAVAFGLSKESAMDFSIEENKKTFQNKKGIQNIDKELLAEKIAILTIENCGYLVNIQGEKGIQQFKDYYLSKS